MRRIPFLLLFLPTIALTSLYATAQDPPPATDSPHEGRDMDGDGDVDERDEVLRRLQRHRPNPRAYRPQQGGKRPLDLPSGGKREREDEDEDVPEVILFFEMEIEGNVFIFFADLWGHDDTKALMKEEITSGVAQLTSRTRFSIVVYLHGKTLVWSEPGSRSKLC